MNDDDELGPTFVAPPRYFDLRRRILSALGFPAPEWKPLLIGIDGIDGSGKSRLASWLSWQLGMPAVHLDLYLVRDSEPLTWRYDDLSRLLDAHQIVLHRPLIVEGVLLLRVLKEIDRAPDFLVFVEKDGHDGGCLRGKLASYFAKECPKERADFVLEWSSTEYDERVMEAHMRRRPFAVE